MSLRLASSMRRFTSMRGLGSLSMHTGNVNILQPKIKILQVPRILSINFCSNLGPSQIATYEEVKDLPNHPEILLIDVREPDEVKSTGQIPTSINIPLGQVAEKLMLTENQFLKQFNRNKPTAETQLIFMCMIGRRSQKATYISQELGFKKFLLTDSNNLINPTVPNIEESLKLTSTEFKSKFTRDGPLPETEIIFYCKTGKRGGQATEKALSLGFENARNYKGSWTEWAEKEGLTK